MCSFIALLLQCLRWLDLMSGSGKRVTMDVNSSNWFYKRYLFDQLND